MSKVSFFIGFILLVLIIIRINNYLSKFKFKKNALYYIYGIILLLYLIIGSLLTFEETKEDFKGVSNTFEGQNNARSRPHRWFDIDTYW